MTIPLESEMADEDEEWFFQRTKWQAILILITSVSILTIVAVFVSNTALSQLSTAIITSVYLTSLYIAWKKLLSSNKETLVIDDINEGFNITNLGKTALSLREIESIELKEVDDGFALSKKYHKLNTILEPGENFKLPRSVGTRIAIATKLCYFNYEGHKKFEETDTVYYSGSAFIEDHWDVFGPLIQIFEEERPNMIPAEKEIPFTKEDVKFKSGAEILNDELGTDYEERRNTIYVPPNVGFRPE